MHTNPNQLLDNQFVDVRHVGAATKVTAGDYHWEEQLNTQLAAEDSSYYDDEMLHRMTVNDKVFAVRNILDSAGIGIGNANTSDPALVALAGAGAPPVALAPEPEPDPEPAAPVAKKKTTPKGK